MPDFEFSSTVFSSKKSIKSVITYAGRVLKRNLKFFPESFNLYDHGGTADLVMSLYEVLFQTCMDCSSRERTDPPSCLLPHQALPLTDLQAGIHRLMPKTDTWYFKLRCH